MEFNNNLNEASALDPVEKMRLLDIGERDSNVKAMSDSKLRMNHQICLTNKFMNALSKIEKEMIDRGLITEYTWEAVSPQLQYYIDSYIKPENISKKQWDFISANLNDARTIYLDAKNDSWNRYKLPSYMVEACAIVFCKLLKAPQATQEAIENYFFSDPVSKSAIRHIITEFKNNQAITEKMIKFLNNDFTEGFNPAINEDIEKHDELNPKLWDGNTLKPEVTEKINQIVDEFLEGLNKDGIAIVVKNVILIGSNCSYNYTKDSDLDIHIIADTSTLDDKDLYDKLYSAYRSLFDKKFEIDFYDIPVEIYVETEGMPRVSNGCYSVMNNEWIKEPIAEDIPELDQEAFDKEFKIWEDRYNKIIMSTKEELKEELNEDKSFGDFLGDMLEQDSFIFLQDICNSYFKQVIQRDLGAFDEKKYRYYKQRFIKELEKYNLLDPEDKTFDWDKLNRKYLSGYSLKTELKKGNTKPYATLYKLATMAGLKTWLLPDPQKFIKEELKEDINNTNKILNNRGKDMERNFRNFDDAIDALNEINDEEAKEVVDNTEEIEANEKVADNNCIAKTANDVMMAYQNAARWLDSVKEAIYIYLNCPFFSSFVHELAHTMPSRFDSFGDILHTVNMEIPYPATAEISKKPATLDEAFTIIFNTLDAIKVALNAFIKCTDEDYHGMSCAAEACLNDIESEYPMLYRLQAKAKECGDDTITFDKFVGQYVEHKDGLLESLKEGWDKLEDDSEIVDSWYLPIEDKPKIRFIKDREDSYSSFIDVVDLSYQAFIRGSLLQTISDILYDLDQEDLEKLFSNESNLQKLCSKLTDMSMKYSLTYEKAETAVKEFINSLAKNESLNESAIGIQNYADKIEELLDNNGANTCTPFIDEDKNIIIIEAGRTGWEGTYKDALIKEIEMEEAGQILKAHGYNNIDVFENKIIVYPPKNLDLKESAKNYTVKLINEDTRKEELKKFDSEEEAIKFYNDKAAKLKKDKNGTITVSFKKYKYNYDEAEQTKPEYRSYNTTEYIK